MWGSEPMAEGGRPHSGKGRKRGIADMEKERNEIGPFRAASGSLG